MSRTIIAREGERVTCEMGHKVATVRRTFGGQDICGRELFDFDIEPPAPYTRFEQLKCSCGSPWCRVGPNHPIELHVEGEWR